MTLSNRRDFLVRTTTAIAGLAAAQSFTSLASAAAPASDGTPLAPPDKQAADAETPIPVDRKAGYAIVGLGKLAMEEILPAFGMCRLSQPVALVSGHPEKARKVAKVHEVAPEAIYNYENFDEIAKNDKIDIVYIVLPNSMHAEFTIRALKAGKHVLCEKPLAVSSKEAEAMVAAAKDANRMLMTAYRLHYEPFNEKVIAMCQQKALGDVKTFSAFNCQNVEAPNIRLSSKLGGGPLGDVGVYCINAARYVTGEEPVSVYGTAHQPADDPRFREVPESVAFTLSYPSGAKAACHCSFGTGESRHYRVNCTKGFIDLDGAFAYKGQSLRVKSGDGAKEPATDARILIEPANHFAEEMDHFSDAVLRGRPCLTPGEMGLADVRIIEAIHQSIASGQEVKVG